MAPQQTGAAGHRGCVAGTGRSRSSSFFPSPTLTTVRSPSLAVAGSRTHITYLPGTSVSSVGLLNCGNRSGLALVAGFEDSRHVEHLPALALRAALQRPHANGDRPSQPSSALRAVFELDLEIFGDGLDRCGQTSPLAGLQRRFERRHLSRKVVAIVVRRFGRPLRGQRLKLRQRGVRASLGRSHRTGRRRNARQDAWRACEGWLSPAATGPARSASDIFRDAAVEQKRHDVLAPSSGEGSAHSRTVLPWLSRTEASAPLDKSAWRMPRSPLRAAIISAVAPRASVTLTGAPVASSWRTTVS